MKAFLRSNKKYVIENQYQFKPTHIVSGHCEWASSKPRTDAAFVEILATHNFVSGQASKQGLARPSGKFCPLTAPNFLIFSEMNENDFYFCFYCFVQFFAKVSGEWAKFAAKQELTRLWTVPSHPRGDWAEWARQTR